MSNSVELKMSISVVIPKNDLDAASADAPIDCLIVKSRGTSIETIGNIRLEAAEHQSGSQQSMTDVAKKGPAEASRTPDDIDSGVFSRLGVESVSSEAVPAKRRSKSVSSEVVPAKKRSPPLSEEIAPVKLEGSSRFQCPVCWKHYASARGCRSHMQSQHSVPSASQLETESSSTLSMEGGGCVENEVSVRPEESCSVSMTVGETAVEDNVFRDERDQTEDASAVQQVAGTAGDVVESSSCAGTSNEMHPVKLKGNRFACPACSKTYQAQSTARRHIIAAHQAREAPAAEGASQHADAVVGIRSSLVELEHLPLESSGDQTSPAVEESPSALESEQCAQVVAPSTGVDDTPIVGAYCHKCKKTYASRANLIKHMSKMHPN